MNANKITNEFEMTFPEDFTLLDIETTGLSHNKHEIIEVSALKVRANKITDKFSMLIKPEGRINSFITNLTGISNEMVENAPNIIEVLPKFVNFIDKDLIIGHNVKFDINFIQSNLERLNFAKLTNSSIDTMQLARKYCKLPSHSLKNLAQHYSVSTKGHHRALNDCLITFEIYQNIKQEVSTN